MSNLHLPDETLMAYADGELASDVANAVETAMEDDASLVGRVVAFMRVRRLTRTAAATVAMPMAPQAAIDLIERRVAARRRGLPPRPAWVAGRRLAIRWAAPALAACLGVVATLAATQWRQQAASVVGEPWLAHLSDPALPAALSSLPTGSERALASGVVRAVASYAPSGGDLCREFDLVAENRHYEGVACREQATWTLRFAADLGGDSGRYRPPTGAVSRRIFLPASMPDRPCR